MNAYGSGTTEYHAGHRDGYNTGYNDAVRHGNTRAAGNPQGGMRYLEDRIKKVATQDNNGQRLDGIEFKKHEKQIGDLFNAGSYVNNQFVWVANDSRMIHSEIDVLKQHIGNLQMQMQALAAKSVGPPGV